MNYELGITNYDAAKIQLFHRTAKSFLENLWPCRLFFVFLHRGFLRGPTFEGICNPRCQPTNVGAGPVPARKLRRERRAPKDSADITKDERLAQIVLI